MDDDTRLVHPSYDAVHRLIKSYDLPLSLSDLNKEIVCSSCQLGKGKRLPFYASSRLSTSPLWLIHKNDVWNSPIQSIDGFKYYVIFVDEFSRFTWFYPLTTKFKVFAQIVKFKLMAENQFSTTIKQLQSNGRGDYSSLQFQSFLAKHGIIHKKTYRHTSQQNGLAERKLRHFLEIGLTILAHAHYPTNIG